MSEQAPQVSTPQEEAEVVKGIEKLVNDFNASVEELAVAEEKFHDIDNELFEIIVTDYSSPSSVEAASQNKTDLSLIENKKCLHTLYKKQSKSFRLLQKLRIAHVTYLQQVAQSLQARVKELTDATVVDSEAKSSK